MKAIVLTSLALLGSDALWAQDSTYYRQNTHHYVGVTVEHSLKSGYKMNQDYDYYATLIELEYQKPLIQTIKKNVAVNLLLQPQFNLATYRDWKVETLQDTWEAGVNVGVIFHAYLDDRSTRRYFTISSSTGPHYIHSTPVRQAPGFIFSNNIRIGFHYPIYQRINAEVKIGVRHVSNAGLIRPNHGLDNVFAGLKLTVSLGKLDDED
ncbi:acyloxyacyl hydrolase [Siphonobacter curvatus]|uniref:Acyloxyacyl hydrolase n=1 Tax=Siphonobacter curvatus TaxID=2094562 RepID=A0A2S7IJ04_9BACT|nr:acyloxyacyl hydrolase [Siphonobacter curvatus]PQA56368.1 hypothetical protein C5O19_18700 [Siphonobacter curvatus]